jgi:hypothetical protein
VGGRIIVIVGALLVVGQVGCGGDDDGDPTGEASAPEQQVFDLADAADQAGCELKDTPSRGEADRIHTEGPGVKAEYRGNPPTLGQHWPPGYQAEDGFYEEAPADAALVHTMEHGRVIFWVKPSVPEEGRDSVRALFDEDSYQLVVTPRAAMPYAVAATAWNRDPEPGGTGRTLGCPRWNDGVIDALRAFRDEHRGNGPEPIP